MTVHRCEILVFKSKGKKKLVGFLYANCYHYVHLDKHFPPTGSSYPATVPFSSPTTKPTSTPCKLVDLPLKLSYLLSHPHTTIKNCFEIYVIFKLQSISCNFLTLKLPKIIPEGSGQHDLSIYDFYRNIFSMLKILWCPSKVSNTTEENWIKPGPAPKLLCAHAYVCI